MEIITTASSSNVMAKWISDNANIGHEQTDYV